MRSLGVRVPTETGGHEGRCKWVQFPSVLTNRKGLEMERYWVPRESIYDEEDHAGKPRDVEVVLAADAQATVEALQAQLEELKANRVPHSMQHVIELQAMNNRLGAEVEALQKKYDDLLGKYRQLVDFYDKHNGTPCEQIRHQQQVEALQRERDHAKKMAAVQKEVADNQTWHVCELRQQLSQLQALVRALPVVRIDLDGAYHDTLLARPEDDAVKELLRYRATLDATTPAVYKRIVADDFGCAMEMCDRKDCGLQVVRPGKFQCTQPDCYDNSKGGDGE